MKNAILLHGYGSNPESYWYPHAKAGLENKGYEVWAPQLPQADRPTLAQQLSFVLENAKFTEETILIGHSAGCPLILSALENINTKVRQVIFVAGYSTPLPLVANDILQNKYNWERIKAQAKEFVFINSDDDPWGCDDKQGRAMFDHLGGTLIIRHGAGHMGSEKFNQPYKEFPLLLKLIS